MLKKLFILLLAISFSSLILANDNQISSIEVSGTQRIDVETVISYSKVKVGDTYTEDFDFFGYDFEDFGSLAVV